MLSNLDQDGDEKPYRMLITCHDNGPPVPLTSSATVSVTVMASLSDHVTSSGTHSDHLLPIITFPTTGNDTVRVSAVSMVTGHVVANVTAGRYNCGGTACSCFSEMN